jgi:hypothetical protein
VQKVNGVAAPSGSYWAFYVNNQPAETGVSCYKPQPGDLVELRPYGAATPTPIISATPTLSASSQVNSQQYNPSLFQPLYKPAGATASASPAGTSATASSSGGFQVESLAWLVAASVLVFLGGMLAARLTGRKANHA